MDFLELKKKIESENLFKLCCYENDSLVMVTIGIDTMMKEDKGFKEDVDRALKKFQGGNFGTFYCDGEEPTKNNEYGEYESSIKENIYIHREVTPTYEFIVYFDFER